MKNLARFIALTGLLCAGTAVANDLPDNLADCEVLMMRFVADEAGNGGMQVSTYGPAEDYIASVYDDEDGHLKKLMGDPIRALLCERDDVIPVETDYALMATGIPFILSQDFDDTETDSLTIYWRHDHFDYVYKGYPLSEDTEGLLKDRLADFAGRDHGLNVKKKKGPDVISTQSVRLDEEPDLKNAEPQPETVEKDVGNSASALEAMDIKTDDSLVDAEDTELDTEESKK
ncbi:hypothetical protein [Litorimonas sp. WD9-15]|uniref:hypothetical protein n=1 Tax=Litorimonas sp. WD9-15 TaxID=3418716 RepID=UPI003D024892